MKQPKKRKRGGQPKPAAERKRNNVTIRMIDDLRTKLEAASRASGRSLSEEVAWRLTMSFLFNHEIQGIAQVQQGLGNVLMETLTKQGWRVGRDELRFISPRCDGPLFMAPRDQELLRVQLHECDADLLFTGRRSGVDPSQSEDFQAAASRRAAGDGK